MERKTRNGKKRKEKKRKKLKRKMGEQLVTLISYIGIILLYSLLIYILLGRLFFKVFK
jgi:hypothetical protein